VTVEAIRAATRPDDGALEPEERATSRPVSTTHPTRLSSVAFAAKAIVFRARRLAADLRAPPPRLSTGGADFTQPAGASRSALWSDETLAERALQLGKVQNLRVAARTLDGLFIPAGAVFSFWRNIGLPSAARGYTSGRMLQQGCMVASTGGGLCQLSNALYEVALQAGCRIVERHAHSRIVPGSLAAEGRDATVAWNYVDLRFIAERDLRLSVRLDRDTLTVRLLGEDEAVARAPAAAAKAMAAPLILARSCASCGETQCFMHEGAAPEADIARQAFLVDEAWPEFKQYVQQTGRPTDRLGLPLDGAVLGLARYAWPTDGLAKVSSAPVEALRRSLALRRAGGQGALRRNAELDAARRIAARLSKTLSPEIVSVSVAQSYLPFLWCDGVLGGRDVTVLMTRLPMAVLQARLDAAASANPLQATLADFRAPVWLAAAEAEALADAVRIVTPHAEIAALFGARAVQLPWHTEQRRARDATPVRRIAFPGPTVARKGAYALREAAMALDLEVMPLGAELEGDGFWRGVRIAPPGDWTTVDAVVQPAMVEDQPRRLLAALAAGIPVIATAACGLEPQPGLVLLPRGNVEALIAALSSMMDTVRDRKA
jgi:hypothetical protein